MACLWQNATSSYIKGWENKKKKKLKKDFPKRVWKSPRALEYQIDDIKQHGWLKCKWIKKNLEFFPITLNILKKLWEKRAKYLKKCSEIFDEQKLNSAYLCTQNVCAYIEAHEVCV